MADGRHLLDHLRGRVGGAEAQGICGLLETDGKDGMVPLSVSARASQKRSRHRFRE